MVLYGLGLLTACAHNAFSSGEGVRGRVVGEA